MIAVDYLGHGNSDRPPLDYTLPLFSGEVAALVERLSLAPVTLIGHMLYSHLVEVAGQKIHYFKVASPLTGKFPDRRMSRGFHTSVI